MTTIVPRRLSAFRLPALRLPAAPRERSVAAGFATWVALVAAGLIAWTLAYAFGVSALQERRDQSVLYGTFRQQLSQATAPLGGAITPGAPVALLSIPAAGLDDCVVVEGTASGDLEKGPGHRRDTALPGQAGVALIFGRAHLFGGPFGELASLHRGQRITVTTGQGIAHYLVTGVRRAGDPFPPALETGRGRLTLVTSDGGGWRTGWAANRAVYVDAELQGSAFPTPGGRPASVPESEQALRHDPAALYPLVLWLPLLGVVAVAVTWMRHRWGGWQTWLVAVPVVLAVLWAVTQDAVRLLPNLL